jgi:tripeptidyl-peptidase-1
MHLYSLTVLYALAAAAQGAAVPSSHVVHEKRTQPMQTWVKRDRLSPKAIVPMRVGLTQRNLERVDEFLMDV